MPLQTQKWLLTQFQIELKPNQNLNIKNTKLKKLIRMNNFNHNQRTELWIMLIQPEELDLLIDFTQEQQLNSTEQDRNLNNTAKLKLNLIYKQILNNNPDISYAPNLIKIISLLFYYIEDENVIYNCVSALLKRKDKLYIIQTFREWDFCCNVVQMVLKRYKKSTYNKLTKKTNNIKQVFTNWFDWLFEMPIHITLRIFDCYLHEGMKVLYRFIVSLLVLYVKSSDFISEGDGVVDLDCSVKAFCRRIGDLEHHFFKTAFKLRNFSSAEIQRLVDYTKDSKQSQQSQSQTRWDSTLDSSMQQNPTAATVSSHTVGCEETPSFPSLIFHQESSTWIKETLLTIWSWLPNRITLMQPILTFTTEEHGCSLTTFFHRVEDYEPTLLVVKSTRGEIFGCYLSTAWSVRNEKTSTGKQVYFGTGESFLFTLKPIVKIYPWIGKKGGGGAGSALALAGAGVAGGHLEHACELFQYADGNMICIGGGHGTAIRLDADLRFGKTEHCLTFDNEPLVVGVDANDGVDFEIQVLEVFAFEVV